MGLNPQVNSPLMRRPRTHAPHYWFNKTKQHTPLNKTKQHTHLSSEMPARAREGCSTRTKCTKLVYNWSMVYIVQLDSTVQEEEQELEPARALSSSSEKKLILTHICLPPLLTERADSVSSLPPCDYGGQSGLWLIDQPLGKLKGCSPGKVP